MSYSRGSCTWFKFISRLVCYFKVVSLQKLSLYNSFWCISPIQTFINSPTKPTFCGFQNINTNYTIENYDSMREEGPSGKKMLTATKTIPETVKKIPMGSKTKYIWSVLKIPHRKEIIQTTITAVFRFLPAIKFEYCIVNLIAMSLSNVTSIKWRQGAVFNTAKEEEKKFSSVPAL